MWDFCVCTSARSVWVQGALVLVKYRYFRVAKTASDGWAVVPNSCKPATAQFDQYAHSISRLNTVLRTYTFSVSATPIGRLVPQPLARCGQLFVPSLLLKAAMNSRVLIKALIWN
jgi:hypothetical protein